MLHTATLPDGQVRVCLTEDGITACVYVSSMHLVEEKEGQLRQSIEKQRATRKHFQLD